MTTTEAPPAPISAAQSIAGVMAAVGHVAKDGVNTQQNFNFRGIDAVMNAVGPALRSVGGFIKPDVEKAVYEHGSTANGKATLEVRLRVRYSWFGTDGGDPITSTVVAEATDMSDKATAKAMSVAYRTYLLQILALPTTEKDPDEEYIDRGTGEVKKTTAKRAPATPKVPKPLKDWWKLGADSKTVEELTALFDECQAAGQLGVVCDYDAEAGTANEFLRKMKTLKFSEASVPTPTDEDPTLTGGGWPVATIPAAEPTGDDAA